MLVTTDNRMSLLAAERNRKMAASAQAYVRGSTARFYEWLEALKSDSLPHGPGVWICGDCHAGNLGPVADADGQIEVQIRDVDQTVIGNPSHDLIRLGLSLATAVRGSDLPGVTTAKMIEQMIEGYMQAFTAKEGEAEPKSERPDAVRIAMKRAMKRTWKHLAQERIDNLKPDFPPGKRFWPLSDEENAAIRVLFAD